MECSDPARALADAFLGVEEDAACASDRRNREVDGALPDDVVASELAHPTTLIDKTDDAASVVAVALFAFVVLVLPVLVLEAIVVALVAFIVAVVRLVWGRWECEVVAPDGRRGTLDEIPRWVARD